MDHGILRPFSFGRATLWRHDCSSVWSGCEPVSGIGSYELSNPSVFSSIPLLGALQVFGKTDMAKLRNKSVLLTGYLEYLVRSLMPKDKCEILTPGSPDERGCQLSLLLLPPLDVDEVHSKLQSMGIVCDKRRPGCLRVAPVPLYNSFMDVYQFATALVDVTQPDG